MSLLVYSGPTQLSAVDATIHGLPMLTVMLTAVAAHLHVALYGVSLSRRLRFSLGERAIGAFMLTDASYGATISMGADIAFLIGAEVSLYFAWNASTLLGLLFGQAITIPSWVEVGLIAPLMYLVMLVAAIKVRGEIIVALVAAMFTLALVMIGGGSFTVLIASVSAALIGAWLTKPTVAQPS
jgi:predicted branched-subunit amino acid permease